MHKRLAQIKTTLFQLTQSIANHPEQFSENLQHDFTKKRKHDLGKVILFFPGMKGNSTSNELLDFFNCSLDTVTTSAFVQQRSKLLPETMETLKNSNFIYRKLLKTQPECDIIYRMDYFFYGGRYGYKRKGVCSDTKENREKTAEKMDEIPT